MVALRRFLARLRPVAVAPVPTGGGPPADRGALRDAELAPVFDALGEAEAEARRLRERAAEQAAAIGAEAERRAEAVVRAALDRAPERRDAAARRARAGAEASRAALTDQARQRADSLRAGALPLADGCAARVVSDAVARLLREEPVSGPRAGRGTRAER